MWSNKEALIVGLFGVAIFILFSSLNIEAQGLYYDEVHQAPASFVLLNKDVHMFTALKWHKIPLLTMHYSGAIKSVIYGLFLQLPRRSFTVASWRLLGIFLVALGLLLFSKLTYKKIDRISMILFFLLILTDATIILTSRHDWGPTALALLLRLLWLGVWIRDELGEFIPLNTFFLGMITGFSIYEKLSSIVLIFPLLIVLSMNKARRTKDHWLSCAIGVIIGVLPLILINIWSYVKDGRIYSLLNKDVISGYSLSISRIINEFKKYLGLGNSAFVRGWILGNRDFYSLELLESIFISIICLSIIISGLLYWRKNFLLHAATVMVFCYFMIWIGLILLPSTRFVHHWVIGTPFQYIGIILFWLGISKGGLTFNRISKALSSLFVFAILVLLLCRLPIIASTGSSLITGCASSTWDISYTKMAKFATDQQKDSLFLATTWGVGAQIYCLSNGRDNLVYEVYHNYYGPDMLRQIIANSGKQKVYLVLSKGADSKDAIVSHRIIKDAEQMHELHEEPLEPELVDLKSVKCIKYKYFAI